MHSGVLAERELWKPVVVRGVQYPYEVSNLGRVKRSKAGEGTYVGRIISPRLVCGYLQLCLCRNGIPKSFYVHRLVLAAFVSPCPEGHETNHINGIKTDNKLENLEWVTPRQNIQHSRETGLMAIGSRHPGAKLTEEDIPHILDRLANKETQIGVAKDYGVFPTAISHVVTGKTWRHVGARQ